MSYYGNVKLASDWLSLIQNKSNHGWGLNSEQEPSIVNSAEAIFVLKRSNEHFGRIQSGIEFIKMNLTQHLENRGNRTRYVQFALLNLIHNSNSELKEFIEYNISWLLSARNQDGGWGYKANDEQSQLYPTCVSILLLKKFRFNVKALESAYNLILSKRNNGIWSFNENSRLSETATAIATLSIMTCKDIPFDMKGIENFLLKNQYWGTEIENMPGANWEHCSYMWIFPALIKLGNAPHCMTITRGINFLKNLECSQGWLEPNSSLTVRGNFWAVFALDSLTTKFDPLQHSYKIQTENWLHFNVDNQWTIIIPTKLYKWITFMLTLIGILLFLGINRFYGHLPIYFDFILSLIFFIIVIRLTFIRKNRFSILIRWIIGGVVAILTLFQVITGKSILDIFNFLYASYK